MYIQAVWKEQGGNTQIAQLVDVPDWGTAGTKLEYAYPGYDLKNMNLITFGVDPKNINGTCWSCSMENKKEGGGVTQIFIFADTFDMAVSQIRETYGQEPNSVVKTQLTYKTEKA